MRINKLKIKNIWYKIQDWRFGESVKGIDDKPIEDSGNPISSGAIYELEESINSHFDELSDELENKVDTVEGMGLSTNDFSDEYKEKIDSIDPSTFESVIEGISIDGEPLEIHDKIVDLPPYPTELPASDVFEWAKQRFKPAYNLDEISDGIERNWNDKADADSVYTKAEMDSALSLKYEKPEDGISINDLDVNVQESLNRADSALQEHQDISGKANISDLSIVATSGDYSDLSGVPTNISDFTNDAGYITQNDVVVNQSYPSSWRKRGSIENLIEDINNDSTATTGKTYMSTVYYNDLPGGLLQGELKAEIMASEGFGKVVLFTLTSSSNAPYHWEYTSAWGGSGNWRAFVEESQLANVAKSGSYTDLLGKPTKLSDFNNDTSFVSAKLLDDTLVLE